MTSETGPVPRGDPDQDVTGAPLQLKDDDLKAIDLRLARAQGQLGGIRTMLQDRRDCKTLVHQLVAVSKAVDKVGFLLFDAAMSQCLTDRKATSADVKAVERLFLRLS